MTRRSRREGRRGWALVAGVAVASCPGESLVAPARAQAPAPTVAAVPIVSGDQLVQLGPEQLDQLYRQAGPGRMPRGPVRGIPIVAPGRRYAPAASRAGRLVWQGKVFSDDGSAAVNRFFGVRAIRGKVGIGPSWVDGRSSLILDYEGTSLVYGRYRDEIREIAPGLYLGVMFARTQPTPTFTRYFAFTSQP